MYEVPSTDLDEFEDPTSNSYKIRLISAHILTHMQEKRYGRPLMVAMQGPQGCGKSTLAAGISHLLTSPPYSLNVAIVSLDDFYLTHDGLVDLAKSNPDNGLLQGRGQPGTHDIELLKSVLTEASQSSSTSSPSIHLPIFDKSLFSGQGDRSTQTVEIRRPLDVFILEGWSLGFGALPEADIEQRYRTVKDQALRELPENLPVFITHSLPALQQCNRLLSAFAASIYPFFTLFIRVKPLSYSSVYKWRLEQEHHMKRMNEGRGMTDEQVKAFVDRYMPGYELWSERIEVEGEGRWKGRGLGLLFGADRGVVRIEEF